MNFHRPGISDEFLQAAGVQLVEEPEPQLRIPYHDLEGKLTGHWRSRLLKVRVTGQKYDQAPGSGMQVYFTHLALQQLNRLFLTEGEFKTLAMREAGFETIGLPGLHCYCRDTNNNPQILPALFEAVRFADPGEIIFAGDADVVTNLEFYRSGHFLAVTFPRIAIRLLELPIDGPKGVDDLREQLNGQFPSRIEETLPKILTVDPNQSFLVPALIGLETATEAIEKLSSEERIRHRQRVIQMAALARIAKEEPRGIIEQFCEAAQKVARLNKAAFSAAVEDEIRRILGPEIQDLDDDTHDIQAQLDSLTPWPEELPLGKIFPEVYGCWKKYLVTNDDDRLILAFMSVATFFYKETPFRPLLMLTSAEEESGKTTSLRLIRRLGFRILSATSISAGSVHRVFDHYDANLSIDEAKANIKEEPALVTALNNGFDEESAVVLRWDTDLKTFVSFRTDCFKILAGIGSYLNHDTVSRSFVITLERATAEEYKSVVDFAFCELSETQPIARKLLTWANAHRAMFRELVLEMMRRLPKRFRGRVRQKFSVLYALGLLAGEDWYRKLEKASFRILERASATDVPLHHQLLTDIHSVLEHQQFLRSCQDLTCKLKIVRSKDEPDREFVETTILIGLLLALPEGPWRAYGKNKKQLDGNGLFFLLKNYGIRTSERKKIGGVVCRGLFVDVLQSIFSRWHRESETQKETFSGDAGSAEFRKSENQTSPASPASEVVGNEQVNPVTPSAEKTPESERGVTEQVVEPQEVTSSGDGVTPLFGKSPDAASKVPFLIPPSTPSSAFCNAASGELEIQKETFSAS